MKVKRGIVCCPMRCNRKYTPSTTKYSCTRSNNKGLDLIKPVDLTTVYRKYRGWRNMLIPPRTCSRPNPKCGKFQRTLDPVSSISKQKKKLKLEGRSPRFKEIFIYGSDFLLVCFKRHTRALKEF